MPNPMFDLTPYTSRAAKQRARTIVIQRMEINCRLAIVLAISIVPGFLAVGFTWPLFHELALVMLPLVMAAAWFIFYRQDKRGLRLRTYQTIQDRLKAKSGELYVAGKPVSVNMSDLRILVRSSLPAPGLDPQAAPSAADGLEDLFAGGQPQHAAATLRRASWDPRLTGASQEFDIEGAFA